MTFFVIPAKAGIHELDFDGFGSRLASMVTLDSRLRGNDDTKGGDA